MHDTDILWNHEEPISKIDGAPDVPDWIVERDISPNDVAAIVQGGCASGAYMPAVTYHQALATMNEHGDNVLEAIEGAYGDPLELALDHHRNHGSVESWAGLACYFVSLAVELWASGVEEELAELLSEAEEEDEEAAEVTP